MQLFVHRQNDHVSLLYCIIYLQTHTHTHQFNSPLSATTQVSRYQKGKTNLDFTGARDTERQWYQLGHIQICTSLQTDNYASTPPSFKFFTGRMPFLPPNQQRQSTEGIANVNKVQVTTYNNRVIKMCINAICHWQTVTTDLKCKSFFSDFADY